MREGIVYLDNAATTQKPQRVIDAISNFYLHTNANPNRGLYKLSQEAGKIWKESRETVADFINADFEETIFTSGTTDGLNKIARMLVKEGDRVILSEMEHHSNIVPWQLVGAKIDWIPVNEDYTLDYDWLQKNISGAKVVSIVHASNVLGTINDIKRIREIAKDAHLVVDAAQFAPHISIDVKDLGCDFLVFSGHKVYGPMGTGVMYGKREHLEKLTPPVGGGDMISTVSKERSEWNDLPFKYEAGTQNVAGVAGLAEAVRYIGETEKNDLTNYVLSKVGEVEGLKLIGPTANRVPVFSFSLDGVHPHDVASMLDESDICVRAGFHCAEPLHKVLGENGTFRISLGLYNTKEEIDIFFEKLKGVRDVFRKDN